MKKVLLVIAVLASSVILMTGCQQTAVTSAKVYLQQANYDKAIEQCLIAVETVPTDAEAWFVLGQAYGRKKMYMEMNEAFTKSLENSNVRAEDIEQERLKYWIDVFNLGVNQIKQDKVEEASGNFLLATKLIPDKTDAHKNLAYTYILQEKNEEAINVYKEALEIEPDDLELKNYLGSIYYQAQMYDEAIEVLTEVVEKADPQSKEFNEALYNLAYSYDLKGEQDQAIATYQKALEASPNDKDLMFNMGRLYFMQENFENAIESFKKVLGIDPDDFDANYNIGNALIQSEKFEDALAYLKKATEVQPENANAWTLLGIAYVRTGDAEKGQEAFDKAEEFKVE